tara:strand:- start:149 stop:997 length:849 start_codon:yes stop_codon:yes gene_type:complete
MKLLMENWRNFVSLEEDADKANQEINGLINEYISRNPSLLKEYSPAFLGLLDDEDDEEEAEEVIDDIEDEVEDELEDEEEEEEESSYDDAEVDTSIGDEASRIGTKVGVGAGAVARFVLATSGELVNQIALGTYPLIMKALGSAAGLRNFVKGLGKAGGDVLAMFPESAQQFIKSFQEGKEIKELAKNNPEGFLQALKTTEEKIFDLELPGVKNSATAAVFLHQSLKGPRRRRKSIRAAMKKAAAESDFSVPQIEALLANYLAMAAHAPEATTQTSLEVEEV